MYPYDYRFEIESSVIRTIYWNSTTEELFVEISSGKVYGYHPVPQRVWAAFTESDSAGRFWSQNIRDTYAAMGQVELDHSSYRPPLKVVPSPNLKQEYKVTYTGSYVVEAESFEDALAGITDEGLFEKVEVTKLDR